MPRNIHKFGCSLVKRIEMPMYRVAPECMSRQGKPKIQIDLCLFIGKSKKDVYIVGSCTFLGFTICRNFTTYRMITVLIVYVSIDVAYRTYGI